MNEKFAFAIGDIVKIKNTNLKHNPTKIDISNHKFEVIRYDDRTNSRFRFNRKVFMVVKNIGTGELIENLTADEFESVDKEN